MSSISIRAHFDGQQIILDEPVALEKDARLIVTVVGDPANESTEWAIVATAGLARAYSSDEPQYAPEDLRP